MCTLTLHPSPHPLHPGGAGGMGYWMLVGTCNPSTRKRSKWTLLPETVETETFVHLKTQEIKLSMKNTDELCSQLAAYY